MRRLSLYILVVWLFSASSAMACDPCALYSAARLHGHEKGSLYLSISEQYTDFDRASDVAPNSLRDGELVRGYSTTQFGVAYDLTEEFGLQLTVPLIGRKFDKIERFRTDTDTEFGLGDISLSGSYSFYESRTENWTFLANVYAGVKLPTGDTGDLEEETEPDEDHHHLSLRHHQLTSATGERALTFGTGSDDYFFGLSGLSRYKRFLALADLQYTLRTEGDFNYEFADDFLWSVGPGYYLSLDHSLTVAGLVALSGEFKGKDTRDGELVEASQLSNLYVGPRIIATVSEDLGFEIGLDFRVTGEDESTTVVPGSKLHAAVSYRY